LFYHFQISVIIPSVASSFPFFLFKERKHLTYLSVWEASCALEGEQIDS